MPEKISTFIINLEKRPDRKNHILNEFFLKPEFDVTVVNAVESENGGEGLCMTISHIVSKLVDHQLDYFLLIEDDHQFTQYYSQEFLFSTINQARSLDADILLGGVSWFDNAIHASPNLFSIDTFNATQFVVVFRNFYSKFLDNLHDFSHTADISISRIANNKFVIYPFISTQKEFGYSDATKFNEEKGYVSQIFSHSQKRLGNLNRVLNYYETLFKNPIQAFKQFRVLVNMISHKPT